MAKPLLTMFLKPSSGQMKKALIDVTISACDLHTQVRIDKRPELL
jgi:hypothetical protein